MAALMLASAACNLQRVLDPSLPTSTPASAGALPSPTWTPEATPTTAPNTEARVEAGDLAFFYGDWDTALREYRNAFDGSSDEALSAAALLGIGRSNYEKGENLAAREALSTLLGQYPGSAVEARAYFALAQVSQALGDHASTAAAYRSYLEAAPGVLDSYVQEWLGDALAASLDYAGAISAYQAAAAAGRAGDVTGVQIKIGQAYADAGDLQNALLVYQSIYASTSNDFTKADMALRLGRAYIALGQPEQGYALFQEAVANYPLAYSSYAALVDLVSAEEPVDEFQRGLVDYYAATNSSGGTADEIYSASIAAFDRYLIANPDEHASAAHHFKALAFRALGDVEMAIIEWNDVISNHQHEDYWEDAYTNKATTQWAYQEDYEGAINTLESFVAGTPTSNRAGEFLFTAGRIAERGAFLTRAIGLWQRVVDEYPSSGHAYQALFLSGIAYVRQGNLERARSLFNQANEFALSLEEQSQALFWIGKMQAAEGETELAQTTWDAAANRDRSGYYSERAADLLAGRDPFTPPASYSFDYDIEGDRAEADAWVLSTFNLPDGTQLSGDDRLAGDSRYQRGLALWVLGEHDLARSELESLRNAISDDVVATYQLTNAMLDLGAYRTAIFAARQVLTLAGLSDASTLTVAPSYFNRIRFGGYFADLLVPKANAEGFHPFYVISAMRQESLFDAYIGSSAGAWGLMQIIPSTGQEVATNSGWPPDFETSDLLRPYVSVRLGIDYMEIQANAFDNDLYAILAAYNAGPGWAQYWENLSAGDMDLFVEVVHFPETNNHIKSIYEIFNIYRNLWGTE
jgi:soluble lytic murein transglycosylase